MNPNKFAPEYKHVIHATEQSRRERYHGCVSRQTLRAQLRREEQDALRNEGPKLLHAVVRRKSRELAHAEYRRLLGIYDKSFD